MSNETPRTATEEWKWRRREAVIRDDYACQDCGTLGGPEGDASLEVHHIQPVAEGGSDNLDNLKTLCNACHQAVHSASVHSGVPSKDVLASLFREDSQAVSQISDDLNQPEGNVLLTLYQLKRRGYVDVVDEQWAARVRPTKCWDGPDSY